MDITFTTRDFDEQSLLWLGFDILSNSDQVMGNVSVTLMLHSNGILYAEAELLEAGEQA